MLCFSPSCNTRTSRTWYCRFRYQFIGFRLRRLPLHQSQRLANPAPAHSARFTREGVKEELNQSCSLVKSGLGSAGFCVCDTEGEVVGDGNRVQLGSLKLPTMQLDSTKTPGFIYLQPKLGMPAQNPDNRYWTCLVYASKKNINKFKPRMFYRSELAPNQSPPPYTHSSTADDRVNSQAITFFSDPSFAGVTVMQVPFSAKFVSDWQLLAECYKSPNKLPKEVKPSWDSWKEKIEGFPKGMNLV
ncbi:MAG: hypothetical protein NXY57DRAFT_614004 [Lentinula lateritia]|nr:MAG: hypothetical protein NXY57DRAFT_614004 [Lentinula lateritia]